MQSRPAACAVLTTLLVTAAQPSPIEAQSRHVMIERFVPHTSTVPANAGERVGIYLREKATASAAARFESGTSPEGRVVLFVHGGSVSSIPDYDLDYKDYSWMGFLAEAGFDTFAMDQSGYGRSPRPMMADPCNMSRDDQVLVTPGPLSGPCDPSYPYGSTPTQFWAPWRASGRCRGEGRQLPRRHGSPRIHRSLLSLGAWPSTKATSSRRSQKRDPGATSAPGAGGHANTASGGSATRRGPSRRPAPTGRTRPDSRSCATTSFASTTT